MKKKQENKKSSLINKKSLVNNNHSNADNNEKLLNVEEKSYHSNKKNDKKNKNLNKAKIFIATIIIVAFVFYSSIAVIKLVKNPSNTFLVKEGTVSKEETTTGTIIRDETVVKGENYKNGMEQIIDEGKRVAKGESIFRYYSNGEEKIKEKIKTLDLKIQEAIENNNEDVFSSDTKLLDTQISSKLSEINNLNNLQTIQEYKKSLANLISKKAKIAGELSPSGSYLKKLIDERSGYEKQLEDGAEYVTATTSGMVSYRVDGLEETLTTSDFSKYNKDFLNNLNIKTGQIIPTSIEKGKIINNFICYLACTSKSEEANAATVGQKVKISLPSGKNVDTKIAYIIKENYEESTLILSFTEGIDELSTYRKINFDIIWWNSTGYKVPNSAIITDNNLNYVIRTKNGYLDKVLVKIKKVSDDYTIVTNYSTSEIKDLGLKSNSNTSLILYDELILKPTDTQISETN